MIAAKDRESRLRAHRVKGPVPLGGFKDRRKVLHFDRKWHEDRIIPFGKSIEHLERHLDNEISRLIKNLGIEEEADLLPAILRATKQ